MRLIYSSIDKLLENRWFLLLILKFFELQWGSSAPNFNQPNINPGMIPMNHDFSDLDMVPSEMGYDGQYATKNMPGGSMMGWFD